ncbi:hypothetical protein BDZ94DRAFT_1327182 [Collybia nuda]|uniref:Uncharacterized protein n=1 Tax=Collybia nuda TaxID=64659 RepID=A0A9P5XR43_9AGAR|nr:hypothetical protein BDZ94DRAFT_1327182 [Collybia nuda]
MFSDDPPPSYDFDECLPSPAYSAVIGSTEHLLQCELPSITGCPGCDWIMETKHMKINLGPRMWGLSAPSYGLNSCVDGSISLYGDSDRVECITVTLEGSMKIGLAHRGSLSGHSVLPIISRTIQLYNAATSIPLQTDQQHFFTIAMPSDVEIRGQMTPTPPSFYSLHQNVSCEIFYALKFRMMRKGKGLKRNETKNIKILYLPKSRPSEPPLATIPRPSRNLADRLERIKTVTLHPCLCKTKTRDVNLNSFYDAIFLSLPSPQCFTSGESIPFSLSLVFPENPAVGKLLMRNTRVQLLRRLRITKGALAETIQRDTVLSSSQVRHAKEYTEGVNILRGSIQAGSAGGESSWQIQGVSVEYVLRATLRPPENLIGHIPSFRHEEILQIKTDHWGTLERELNSIGTPAPALGLARRLRPDC